jgi:hypothetical protein
MHRQLECLHRTVRGLAAADQAHDKQQDHRAQDRHQQARQVEAGHALRAEPVHNKAADEGADDAHKNVGKGAHLGILAHDDAGDPSSQGPKDDPDDEVHVYHRER